MNKFVKFFLDLCSEEEFFDLVEKYQAAKLSDEVEFPSTQASINVSEAKDDLVEYIEEEMSKKRSILFS